MVHIVLLYPLGLWLCHMTAYANTRRKVPLLKYPSKNKKGVDKANCNWYSYNIK